MVLRPHQHSIGYTGDGFYRTKDPTNSIKILKEGDTCRISSMSIAEHQTCRHHLHSSLRPHQTMLCPARPAADRGQAGHHRCHCCVESRKVLGAASL